MTYDPSRRRQALRKQREAGCSIYIPGEVLSDAGFGQDDPPPFYRTWVSRKTKGAVYVQLYESAE